jgi:hypothetical protein
MSEDMVFIQDFQARDESISMVSCFR